MRLIWPLLFSLILCCQGHAQTQQDIVFKSRFDLESSEAFINQLRIFLANTGFGDPYRQEIKKPLQVDLNTLINEIPSDTQKWIAELQTFLKVDVFRSRYNLIVEDFGYSLNDFNSEFRPGKSSDQRVEYVTVNFVHGLRLKAKRIVFQVELEQTHNQNPIQFDIEIIEPEFLVSEKIKAELPMGWATSVLPENLVLSLESVNISKIMEKVVQDPELIELNMNDLIVPKLSIKVGRKTIKFDQVKIRNLFMARKEDMKKAVLDILNAKMKKRFGNIIQDNPKELLLPRKFAFDDEIKGVLDIQKMDVNNTGIVQFDFDGHFCEDALSIQKEDCSQTRVQEKQRRKIPLASYRKSLREMNRSLIEKKRNIALSVGENYLNQLVLATIGAGLWEDSLKGNDFVLGPEKSFVLADEKGELFSLYLDIIYKLKGTQRILVGRDELRFPIKFMIALKIEDINEVPHFTIKVKKVATDNKMILEGLPQLGLPTTVNGVPRFKKKVLKAIMKDVGAFEGETLVDLEMAELKGTYLDQLEFFSDGLGRGTATMGFLNRN